MKAMTTKSIQPAARVGMVSEYYFSRKLKEIAERNARGEDIISLAIGSPDMPPAPKVVEVLCEEAQKSDAHGYMPTAGIAEFKESVADWYKRWYGVELNAKNEIQPLIGSKEGILHVTLAFCNPGDKVLIPDPGYPTYTSLSQLLGCNVIKYNLTEENGWQPNFEELESMDLTGVKIMWTNYTHMPTGAPATLETYQKIVDFGKRHGILIVNDNPYSFILNDKPLSIMQIPGAKDVCLEFNSMSKSHNMAGWRVALLVGKAQYVNWILKVKSNIENGTFKAVQMAASEAFRNSPEWHQEANINLYRSRRDVAEAIMTQLGCRFDPKQVGMFLWGRIPDKYTDVEQLTEKVLNEAHVFITPGFIFGKNGERYVRISLCAKREKMQEALERIKKMAL